MCRAALPTGSPQREKVSAGTFQPPPLWGPPPQVGVRELEPAATPPLPRLRRRSFCHRDSVPSAKDTEPTGLVNEQQISCHRE